MSMNGNGGQMAGILDPQKEAELVELYNQMIRVAYANVYNKSDALDVVQEAWVKMLAKRATLRESDKLAAWAKVITRNVAVNVNRVAARTRTWDDADLMRAAGERADRAEELMMEISELLGQLEPAARTLFLYKYYYGLKDQEIANAMSMPVGTVKAKIHRARERLKKARLADLELRSEGRSV
ncbi:RNA polymerase, sigma-24 subunit, ECF subfamily [Thermobacillus xylanilyticus]|uniref:RNA polymerase, sigma-24 subunit, ECF subfamily n=1 Tax=Thermobacillus xylanilyticus TaxID=76633 RepID=A0ABN7S786_THEXY|nr:RNA polymerase sigma factor [Thermobacillus xylanilyticus]REJ12482.1 MAG: RNA polymerase subunit sigma-70 [Paenibacillaceae bacterium]CAG5091819.1 RNA polymerase, sigma-24 subunit, ECF subfamily [Thermobacillus xylanilyticus]